MSTPMSILAAVASLCLLQACATPPAPTPPRAMKMEPLLQVRNSTDQNAATYYRLGKFHQARGNMEAARDAYVQSIGLDRRQIEARNALAVLDSEAGRLDDAKAMLVQLVRDYPRVPYLFNNLAYVYFLRGEPDEAIPALDQALALEPGNARALNNLSLVHTALVEKRARLTAALGLADVMVGKGNGPVDSLQAKAAESAAANAAATAKQAASIAPAPMAAASPLFPEQASQSRMEVVQVLPNVIELRQRDAPAMVEHRQEKTRKPEKAAETATLVATPPSPRSFRFDVANGNGIAGMAARMRDALARRGIHAGRVTNKRPFTTQNTEIEYLAGFEKEAEQVRSALASQVTMTPVAAMAGAQDVRLVLGKDAAGYAALIGESPRLALNGRQAQ
jgi:Tfp pilus assembly protein PilF